MFFYDQAAGWLESDRLFWPSQRLAPSGYPHTRQLNGLCAIYSDSGDDSTGSVKPSGWNGWYKMDGSGPGRRARALLP
jgi:hypothetical protein